VQAQASILSDRLSDPDQQSSISESAAVANVADRKPASLRQYLECLRGFLAGLCLQGALALCFYGMYEFGHMAH
jgi:hypothetical protein